MCIRDSLNIAPIVKERARDSNSIASGSVRLACSVRFSSKIPHPSKIPPCTLSVILNIDSFVKVCARDSSIAGGPVRLA